MTANTNIVAPKVPVNAKNKQPSKAERQRNAFAKAKLAAANSAAKTNIEKARLDYVHGHESQAKRTRVYATMLNDRFKDAMAAFKCHWTAFTSANCRTDNEKAILAAIETERLAVREIAVVKCPSNADKPWSDMRLEAKRLHQGGEKRERVPQPLDKRLETALTKAYRAAMKEERPTDTECDEVTEIGRLLVRYHKVDLAKLG